MTLGRKLLEYRTKNRVTQKQLAEEIGISTITLANIEAEKKVQATTRCRVEMWLKDQEGEK